MGLDDVLETVVQLNESVRAPPFGSARPCVECLEFLSDLVELTTSSLRSERRASSQICLD